ncbi:MAG: hypothetical protein ACAH80_02970 [Alphaproteobacteria bacterium]
MSSQIADKLRVFPWFWAVIVPCLTFFLISGLLKGQSGGYQSNARVDSIVGQVKSYNDAVQSFRDKYNALPGDMAEAGKILPGCTGDNGADCNPHAATAGDRIVGRIDLSKSWKEQANAKTHVPAVSAADESVLFWSHLRKAELIAGIAESVADGVPFAFGVTHPAARIGGGFIVGHLDGSPLPKSLAPKYSGIKGTSLLLVSDEVLRGEAEMNEAEKQAITPLRAGQIDRKLDDGRTGTGYVQAYGSPDCFYSKKSETLYSKFLFWWRNYSPDEGEYNEVSEKKSCGLIFRIAD